MFIAPQVGAFETDLMVNGLNQAQTNITRTKTMADQAEASSYNVAEGVAIIGDSVTLRATPGLKRFYQMLKQMVKSAEIPSKPMLLCSTTVRIKSSLK